MEVAPCPRAVKRGGGLVGRALGVVGVTRSDWARERDARADGGRDCEPEARERERREKSRF